RRSPHTSFFCRRTTGAQLRGAPVAGRVPPQSSSRRVSCSAQVRPGETLAAARAWRAERRSRERPVGQSAPPLVRCRALVPGYTNSEPLIRHTELHSTAPIIVTDRTPAQGSRRKAQRVEVGVLHHHPEANGTAGQVAEVRFAFPQHAALDLVPVDLGTVREAEAADLGAVAAEHRYADAPCGRRAEIDLQPGPLEPERPGDELAAGRGG